MEKQTLPNSTLVLVLGILSVLSCCCHGILGLIFGVIALVLAKKAKQVYVEDPELYSGYSNLKTGRILAIIGVILSVIYLLIMIVALAFYGMDGIQQMQEEMLRDYGIQY